jgi:hypothetical protein
MNDHKSSSSKTYPRDILKRLLDNQQLLPNENAKEFIQLFDSFEDYGKPQSVRDYMAVYQSTVLAWDVLRYQQMKIGVPRSHQRPALQSLLREIQVRTVSKMGFGDAFAKSEARQLAAPWFKDPASRPAMMKDRERRLRKKAGLANSMHQFAIECGDFSRFRRLGDKTHE